MPDPIGTSPFLPGNGQLVQPAQDQASLGQYAQPAPMPVQQTPNATPADVQRKATGWDAFFGQPQVLAALLQFGVNMLQPQPVQQTIGGTIGQALGAAGEAAGRVRTKQLEEGALGLKQQQEQQRIGLEERRTATGEKQAETQAQAQKDEAEYRRRWLDIQNRQVGVSAAHAAAAQAATAEAAADRRARTAILEKQLELDRDRLAQDWLTKNIDKSSKTDAALLSDMYSAVMRTPRLPGEPAPDIGAIGSDFLKLRQTLKSVEKGDTDVFTIGTEQQWRRTLSDPALRSKAEQTFGPDIIAKAEKRIKEIDAKGP